MIAKLERRAGALAGLQLSSIKRAYRRKLEEAGCERVPVWGYVDLSWNTHAGGEYEPHWLPHAHIITESKYRPVLKELAKGKHLKPGTAVKRPMRIDEVKDWLKQCSYACKPFTTHRCDYSKDTAAAKPSKYPLRIPDRKAEVALWLDAANPADRHFLFNMRL